MSEPEQSALTLSSFLTGFVTGLAPSAIVSYIVYRIQKGDSEMDKRDLILLLYRIMEEGRESKDILDEILQNTQGKTSDEQLSYISDEFNQRISELESGRETKEKYVETVLNYKALADAYAGISASISSFDILAADGTITLKRIISSHKQMFPDGYVWAGKLRTQMVEIIGSFSARGRSLNAALSSIQVGVSRPEDIEQELGIILEDWNHAVTNQLKKRDDLGVSEELAHFHQQFLLIHPFLDGNGRIARAILREQVKFLFGVDKSFEFNRLEYYEALHLADLRQMKQLAELILKEIKNG